MEDLKEIIKELGKSQQKTEESLRESQKKTEESLRESQKELQESHKKTEESLRETQKELQESHKKTEESLRKSQKRIRELDNLFTGQWGKLIESLVEGDLVNLLQKRGIKVEQVSPNRRIKRNGKEWELDLVAINGEEIVVVEVKTTLKAEDVKDFIERTLRSIKKILPEYAKHRVFGAVAYLKANQQAGLYAARQGLFVIKATGDSASIVNDPDFKPISW